MHGYYHNIHTIAVYLQAQKMPLNIQYLMLSDSQVVDYQQRFMHDFLSFLGHLFLFLSLATPFFQQLFFETIILPSHLKLYCHFSQTVPRVRTKLSLKILAFHRSRVEDHHQMFPVLFIFGGPLALRGQRTIAVPLTKPVPPVPARYSLFAFTDDAVYSIHGGIPPNLIYFGVCSPVRSGSSKFRHCPSSAFLTAFFSSTVKPVYPLLIVVRAYARYVTFVKHLNCTFV